MYFPVLEVRVRSLPVLTLLLPISKFTCHYLAYDTETYFLLQVGMMFSFIGRGCQRESRGEKAFCLMALLCSFGRLLHARWPAAQGAYWAWLRWNPFGHFLQEVPGYSTFLWEEFLNHLTEFFSIEFLGCGVSSWTTPGIPEGRLSVNPSMWHPSESAIQCVLTTPSSVRSRFHPWLVVSVWFQDSSLRCSVSARGLVATPCIGLFCII